MAANTVITEGIRTYVNDWESGDLEDIELGILDVFNDVRTEAPACGLTISYSHHMNFLLYSEGVEGDEGPRCFGCQEEDKIAGQYDWANVIIPMDIVGPVSESSSDDSSERSSPQLRGTKRKARHSLSGVGTKSHVKRPRNASWGSSHMPSKVIEHIPAEASTSKHPSTPNIDNLTKNAFSVMSEAGHRRHILGVLVQGLEIFLCYYDRAGSICSTPIHLINDSVSALTAILLLHLGTFEKLGFDPSMKPPAGKPLPTHIQGCQIYIAERAFTLDQVVHWGRTLYGRGTIVYAAKPDPADLKKHGHITLPEVVIIKTSWQVTTRELEDGLYRRAAARNVEGVARLYSSCVGDRLSLGPRGKLVPLGDYTDRELRIQVLGPVCMPLYRVVDVDQFKAAFISLVKGQWFCMKSPRFSVNNFSLSIAHHDLYEKAGILHRDISINNLMVDASDPSIGVLIDLDLAATIKDDDGNPCPVKPMLTGTKPFLAIDLLQDTPVLRPYYRHDLESFLYVLAWTLAHYDEGKKVNDGAFEIWHTRTWSDTRLGKLGFLAEASDMESARETALQHTWVLDLGHLFSRGYQARRKSLGTDFDDETLGGHVTFAAFMHVLLNPRPWSG